MSTKPDYAFYRPIADAIILARNNALPKITQKQLAKRAGFSRALVANIELGRQQILVHVLVRIAKALNVSLKELLKNIKLKPGRKV